MRVAFTAALMMAASMACAADEPSTPEAEAEVAAETAEAAEATEAKPVEQPAATEQATAADADDKPFKVPAGYRARKVEGKQMYCTKNVVLGSRFGKDTCRTEAQLRELERQKETVPTNPTCSGVCSSK